MRVYQLHIVILALLMVSCHSLDKPKKPKNLISKEKMANILEDVYILNAAKGTNRSILEENGINPENYILEKYDVDSLQFSKSNDYYAFDVKSYEEIVTTVKDRLTFYKDSLNEQMDLENERKQLERDSINLIKDSINSLKKDSLKKIKSTIQSN